MENQKKYLHQLPGITPFYYRKKLFQTMAPIKYTVINKARANQKRTVLDLKSLKETKLPYFTIVIIFSEKIELSEK